MKILDDPDFEEPACGVFACSPEIYAEMLEANRRALEGIDRGGAEPQTGLREED